MKTHGRHHKPSSVTQVSSQASLRCHRLRNQVSLTNKNS
nr:MAG TPA: hypothetical protein [Caudoviricetes sp.]